MSLKTNIGIDIDGTTCILFEKDTVVPCEESFMLEINIKDSQLVLDFYKGMRYYSKDNTLIGKLNLINVKSGKIELKCSICDTIFKINIDGLTEEYSFINEELEDIDKKEILLRETQKVRTNFINYIDQTLYTLEQIKDKINVGLIDKIKYAKQIIFVDDVTIEEYNTVQTHIETWVNPIIMSLNTSKYNDNFSL
jgi:hypothetical protein